MRNVKYLLTDGYSVLLLSLPVSVPILVRYEYEASSCYKFPGQVSRNTMIPHHAFFTQASIRLRLTRSPVSQDPTQCETLHRDSHNEELAD